MGLSIRGYAKHRKERGLPGGTDAAVRKAIATGRISPPVNGELDPAKADREWASNTIAQPEASQPVARASSPAPKQTRTSDDPDDEGISESDLTPRQKVTLNDVKIAREKVKLKKELRLENEAEKLLIKREPARRFVFNLALFYATDIQSAPDMDGPSMAARLGVSEHAMVQELKDFVRRHLERISKEPKDLYPMPGDADVAS